MIKIIINMVLKVIQKWVDKFLWKKKREKLRKEEKELKNEAKELNSRRVVNLNDYNKLKRMYDKRKLDREKSQSSNPNGTGESGNGNSAG